MTIRISRGWRATLVVPGTIRKVGAYLQTPGATVSAFYASNVEHYLDDKQQQAFYANVLTLRHGELTFHGSFQAFDANRTT